ncbi:MAG: DUF58 domain-containing protein [Planctomycetota bacterium]
MANSHGVSKSASRVSRVLTTDFCPWANRFVYWLKEPIGWFVLATLISVMVGLYFSPVGWTLAASLSAIMLVGMLWPFIAVRTARCELRPEVDCVHEGDACRMLVSVRNRIPMPLWGLAVEGYLDCDREAASPTVGLACVPPLCISQFGLAVTPAMRGRYPIHTPTVACSFPFGIWTARRPLAETKTLTVWPKIYRIEGTCPMMGRALAEQGDGNRGGRSGDFVGVRGYRRGDSAKHINWVASAKVESLMVTERSGPQCVELDVMVDTTATQSREQLADRIRVAASVLVHLHQLGLPMRITIGNRPLRLIPGATGRRQILDALAMVPTDGTPDARLEYTPTGKNAAIVFTRDAQRGEVVRMIDPDGGMRRGDGRSGGGCRERALPMGESIGEQVRDFWTEVHDVDFAA